MLKIINKSVRLKTMILNFINIFHYLIDFFKLLILKLSNLINRDKFFNNELIILTGCDFTFYDSFVQLIKSIRQYEKSIKIIFYDLGLSDTQATELKNNYPLIEHICSFGKPIILMLGKKFKRIKKRDCILRN